MESYSKRFESFKNALLDLSTAKNRKDLKDRFVINGVISKFCLVFDLSWKVLKDIIRDKYCVVNYVLCSPAENIKQAFACGTLDECDSEFKISLMRLRNQFSHDYNSELAKEKLNLIVNEYTNWFLDLQDILELESKDF